MALLFLLKKKSEGGISSAEIRVRSSIKMTSELGFPRLDCKGVNEIMGLPISVDGCFSVVLVTGLSGVDETMYPVPFLEKLQAELLFEYLVGLIMKSPLSALRLHILLDFPQYPVCPELPASKP
jgi:hypothetical protein